MERQRLLERFLQYVQIESTAIEDTDNYPSSPGQIEIGKLLVEQMQEMGIEDAAQDKWGIVTGTLPGNAEAPLIAFNSHVDTSPETSGKDVRPNVIENFDGSDIQLSGDPSKKITAASCPELPLAKGKTIITTDGTTLLGGDDKAGVAIIMELANHLVENPDIKRGPIKIFFTCDEEIGRGVDHVDVDEIGAVACYNFDGGGQNDIDVETFSADLAVVTFKGINIHPAIAKDKMVNSIRAAGQFIARLPAELAPERTEGRDGFLHPYVIEGGVAKTTLKILLRDFDTTKLSIYADQLKKTADQVASDCPGTQVLVEITEQYRNMADGLGQEPRAVAFAIAAHKALGREPQTTIVRGGTDGSRLTEIGLPTPNLSSGQHNIHSPLEWACLDEMLAACEVGVEIVKKWADTGQ
jgi:tripeptide aminopeptidase